MASMKFFMVFITYSFIYLQVDQALLDHEVKEVNVVNQVSVVRLDLPDLLEHQVPQELKENVEAQDLLDHLALLDLVERVDLLDLLDQEERQDPEVNLALQEPLVHLVREDNQDQLDLLVLLDQEEKLEHLEHLAKEENKDPQEHQVMKLLAESTFLIFSCYVFVYVKYIML